MSAPDSECRLYSVIIDECADAILYSDREGVIRLWNRAAARLFGFSSEEALGESLDLIIPENLRGRHWEGYHRVMATGESRYLSGGLLSSPGLRKDGSRVSLEFSLAVIRDEHGAIDGCLAVLRDVTARWEKEKGLRERLKELERGITV